MSRCRTLLGLFLLALTMTLPAACANIMGPDEPTEAEMKSAYLDSDGANLGKDLSSDTIQLEEFRKLSCRDVGDGLFRCRFFAKYGLISRDDPGLAVFDDVVGMASGFVRDANFFPTDAGKWLCTEVSVPSPTP